MSEQASVIMLAGSGHSTNIVYNALAREFRIDRVVLEDAVPRAQLLRRRARRLGLRVVLGQALFQVGVVPLLRAASRERLAQIRSTLSLDVEEIPSRIISRVRSANSKETVSLLKRFQPAVVVVNGTRILSKEVLRSIPARFLNTHAGITPLYRGVHGGYWALVNHDPRECGVTVHLVDEGIDTGGILGQARIQPTSADNFVTYPYLQLAAALPILIRSVHGALDGKTTSVAAPSGQSRLWSHPTIGQYVWHRFWRKIR